MCWEWLVDQCLGLVDQWGEMRTYLAKIRRVPVPNRHFPQHAAQHGAHQELGHKEAAGQGRAKG